MKKIVVIGSGGSGKSTLSRELGVRLGIPVTHLDAHYWRPNWQKPSDEEWRSTVERMVAEPQWIMDGNFGGTRQIRLDACGTVIFLDLPRYICMFRILKRAIKYRNSRRPDMAEGCNEKMDLEFFQWVWNFPNSGRVRILQQLEQLKDKLVITLRSRSEVKQFLDGLGQA